MPKRSGRGAHQVRTPRCARRIPTAVSGPTAELPAGGRPAARTARDARIGATSRAGGEAPGRALAVFVEASIFVVGAPDTDCDGYFDTYADQRLCTNEAVASKQNTRTTSKR